MSELLAVGLPLGRSGSWCLLGLKLLEPGFRALKTFCSQADQACLASLDTCSDRKQWSAGFGCKLRLGLPAPGSEQAPGTRTGASMQSKTQLAAQARLCMLKPTCDGVQGLAAMLVLSLPAIGREEVAQGNQRIWQATAQHIAQPRLKPACGVHWHLKQDCVAGLSCKSLSWACCDTQSDSRCPASSELGSCQWT